MKKLTVTEASRNFSRVLVRHHRPIVRLVPEPPEQNALQVLGELYRTLDGASADALAVAVSRTRQGKAATVEALRNPGAT